MEKNNNAKRVTNGRFDFIGRVAVDSKVFAFDVPGKNNTNWLQNIFNPKIEGDNGESMYVRISDGYDKVKGKTLYAKSTSDAQLEIPFADRNNANMIKLVDDKSFVKVAISKKVEKNDQGKEYKVWDFKKFLSLYDAIRFISEVMPLASKNKIRITGRVKYSTYNGEIQRGYELQTFYLLENNEDQGKELPNQFSFVQNIVLTKDCIDKSQWENDGVAVINGKLFQKKPKVKDTYEILHLPILIKADTQEKKDTYERVINRYLTVQDDNVRRINIEGFFNSGFIASNVTGDDLPQEAKDLILDGLYTEEEVFKMYANRESVDEVVFKRPLIKKINDKPTVDMADNEYTIDDINKALTEMDVINETQVGNAVTAEEVDELLGQLADL